MHVDHVNSISVFPLFIFCAQFLFLLGDRVVLSSGLSFSLALTVYASDGLACLLSYTIVGPIM
jgi:hypothetical protein